MLYFITLHTFFRNMSLFPVFIIIDFQLTSPGLPADGIYIRWDPNEQ